MSKPTNEIYEQPDPPMRAGDALKTARNLLKGELAGLRIAKVTQDIDDEDDVYWTGKLFDDQGEFVGDLTFSDWYPEGYNVHWANECKLPVGNTVNEMFGLNEHLQTMIREGVEEALIMNTIKAALDRYIEELAASETMYTADTLSKMGRQEVDKMLKNNGMHLSDEAIEELGNYFYSQMRASGNFADLSTLQSPFGWRVLPMSRG